MKKNVDVDSLNLSYYSFEQHFTNTSKFEIITVLGTGISNKDLWFSTFGNFFPINLVEAKIIFCENGLIIPLKRYASNPNMQTIEFAGLQGYNERSKLLRELLNELLPHLQDCFVRRCDVCIDYRRRPLEPLNNIRKKRTTYPYMNTTYYKTQKEKKTNSTLDIKFYDKRKQAKLDEPLHRLEFVFKGSYFQNMKLSESKKIFSKCQKSILNFSGVNSRIVL
jgi:hypothetical protein